MAKDKTPPTVPSYRIRALHDRKSGAFRKFEGASGMRYLFLWDDKIKAYAYTPKSEIEADDIFATVGKITSAAFAPVSIALTPAEVSADEPAPAPEFIPATVPQIEECIHRGILISEDDSTDVVQRLLEVAYKAERKGEIDGVRKADQEIAQLKQQIENINAMVGQPVETGGIITTTGNANPPPLTDTRTPQEKRRDTLAANKAKAAQTGEPS